MKMFFATVALAAPLMASAAFPNLLANSSFETGVGGLASWTSFTGGGLFPPVAITSGGSVFGTTFPPNAGGTAAVGNPLGAVDPALSSALYFVDDIVGQVVYQTIVVSPGIYSFGFDYFLPANGRSNTAASTVQVQFGGQPITVAVTTAGGASGWTHLGFTAVIAGAPLSAQTFSIGFLPTGSPTVFGKDFLIDRTYVIAVPEPTTYGLFGAGLVAIGLFARRRGMRV